MIYHNAALCHFLVALRKESVDRNSTTPTCPRCLAVALRKESVDRNPGFAKYAYGRIVALRKESVDRNGVHAVLPAVRGVALRKESVDRNANRVNLLGKMSWSLSARRAWIEIINRLLM